MNEIEQQISPYIEDQFPRQYRKNGPTFIAFMTAYYQWLEQDGNALNQSRTLLQNRDIDTTLDVFVDHFKKKYMANFPTFAVGDKRFLQKHIKELLSAKGTEQGLELLFRLLYNAESEIYYPGQDVLKASDGVWNIPMYLEVNLLATNILLIGQTVTGVNSKATAIVEDLEVNNINGRMIHVLQLSNIHGSFQLSESLSCATLSQNQFPILLGSLNSILINETGFNYEVGDLLSVTGGNGINGKAVVQSVAPKNGVVTFELADGGSGYANDNPWAPTIVTVTPTSNGNPGLGATFAVGDLIDTSIITTAVDTIAPQANVVLSANDYGFAHELVSANTLTPIDQALNIQDITVGTIASLIGINPGAGYNGPVSISVVCPVIEGLQLLDPNDGTIEGNNAVVIGFTGSGEGTVASLSVVDSGIGYLKGDVLTLSKANNDFVVGGSAVLGALGTGSGSWKDNRGFLDEDKYIQDSFYYQDYSYEIRSGIAVEHYASIIKQVWHVAGTQNFGKLIVLDVQDSASNTADLLISTS